MSTIDWIVLITTLLLIVLYGIYKSRNINSIEGFLLSNRELPWYNVGLSVMATQASAITFLSAPGLAYTSGMSFVQFYFGLPLAMIVLCVTFVPIFHKLQVFTAYEFLEKRFDIKTRSLTALLFLIQRGISTGITIFAPSIILSAVLHVDVFYTTLLIGGVVVLYTTYGGTKAVSYTQLLQMGVIFGGLLVAGMMVIHLLPSEIGFVEALHIAGESNKTNAIDFTLDWNNQYTVWTGLIGGFFLQLSYFGTDQSQVGRYLTGSSVRESRMGLLMNGLLKVPMQFCILLIGVLVFVYYQYNSAPIFFNPTEIHKIENSVHGHEYKKLQAKQDALASQRVQTLNQLHQAKTLENTNQAKQQLKQINTESLAIRTAAIELIKKNDSNAETNDNNYIFLSFVTSVFPKGLIGLLIAIIMLASMGATSSAINSLASTTVIDIYKRLINKNGSEKTYLNASRICTFGWGIFTIIVAIFANKLGNLLEAVNILGSLFYGTILGIFLVAFYFKSIHGNAVFWAAICTEAIIVYIWMLDVVAFLWLNLIGCILVILFGYLFKSILPKKNKPIAETTG
ncbi:sodium:solute symporter family transporter [Sphingobacterium bovistauri]|uniref:Sodium:solute symporter n=1 Tax=Sphingobacterium bovistauri TaxID=2781959 RepID=A0ABS7Z905_9SPHI|nr:sodium:solute symporter [Sphingobacterium bovistauri]MCA5006675.1 sodium:solute symporter [Sphingobacterium bovistauri]